MRVGNMAAMCQLVECSFAHLPMLLGGKVDSRSLSVKNRPTKGLHESAGAAIRSSRVRLDPSGQVRGVFRVRTNLFLRTDMRCPGAMMHFWTAAGVAGR